MNPLFTFGEELRFHDSRRFQKKAQDGKHRFYHSFVKVLTSVVAESCRSRTESAPGTPSKSLFTMGKQLQLCDSRRLRKKDQDAKDDVIISFVQLVDAHFWGWKGM